MVLSRREIDGLFAKDARRYEKLKETHRDKVAEANPFDTGVGSLFKTGVGALAGYATGGLGGAVMGGVSGAGADNPIDAGLKGVSTGSGLTDIAGGSTDVGKQLTSFINPENFEKTSAFMSGMENNAQGDALGKIGKITQADVDKKAKTDKDISDANTKRDNKVKDATTAFERKKELAKIRKSDKKSPDKKDEEEIYQYDLDATIESVLLSITDKTERTNLINKLIVQLGKDYNNKLISYKYYQDKIKELKEN